MTISIERRVAMLTNNKLIYLPYLLRSLHVITARDHSVEYIHDQAKSFVLELHTEPCAELNVVKGCMKRRGHSDLRSDGVVEY